MPHTGSMTTTETVDRPWLVEHEGTFKWAKDTFLIDLESGRACFAQTDDSVPPFVTVHRDQQVVRWQETGMYGVANKLRLRRATVSFEAIS